MIMNSSSWKPENGTNTLGTDLKEGPDCSAGWIVCRLFLREVCSSNQLCLLAVTTAMPEDDRTCGFSQRSLLPSRGWHPCFPMVGESQTLEKISLPVTFMASSEAWRPQGRFLHDLVHMEPPRKGKGGEPGQLAWHRFWPWLVQLPKHYIGA